MVVFICLYLVTSFDMCVQKMSPLFVVQSVIFISVHWIYTSIYTVYSYTK